MAIGQLSQSIVFKKKKINILTNQIYYSLNVMKFVPEGEIYN